MATVFVSTGSDFFVKREKKKSSTDKMWKIVDFLADKKRVNQICIVCIPTNRVKSVTFGQKEDDQERFNYAPLAASSSHCVHNVVQYKLRKYNPSASGS